MRLILSLLLIATLWSCKRDTTENTPLHKVSIKGSVEKGPFVQGSTVIVYELNDNFSPTGKSFKTELLDDKGTFSLPDIELKSRYVQVSVSGYYFDEITGNLSKSTLSLNAIAEVSGTKNVNVNILTHLEEKRVKRLIKEGKTFDEAKQQAQKEIYRLFYIKESLTQSLSEDISLIKGDDHSAALLGISATLLLYTDSDNAQLTELLSKVSIDLEDDGIVEPALRSSLKNTIGDINENNVIENIKRRYKQLGLTVAFTSIFDVYLDIVPTDPIPAEEIDFAKTYSGLLSMLSNHTQQYYFLEGLYANTIMDQKWNQDPFYKHQLTANNEKVNSIFASAYRNIAISNNIIFKSRKNSETAEKAYYQYKVYPMYSMLYWQLINFFGNPIYKHANNLDPLSTPRSLEKEVILDMINNLEKSILELTGKDNNLADLGRIMIAKHSLHVKDYAKAKKYVDEVINSKRYQLSAKGNIHEEDKEMIFGALIGPESEVNKNYENYLLYAKKGKYISYLRYTEVLLLAAEISMKQKEYTEAINLINQIRIRDGESAISEQAHLLSAIQLQYKNHLNNEGTYFSFLKRNDLAESELKIDSFRKLFPIPTSEMDLNKLVTQNPGY